MSGDDSAPINSAVGINFNADGTIWLAGNPIGESRAKIVPDFKRYSLQTMYSNQDMTNTQTYLGLKWNFQDELASAPQDRYSIYANGHYDLTDKISVFAGARFAESTTRTILFGTNAITGWEATVPYNPTTDSPIDPTLDYTDATVLAAVTADPAAFFAAHPNPSFIPTGSAGAGHPVPAEMAWLLNSRRTPIYDYSTTPPTITGWTDRSGERWQPQWNPDNSLPGRQTLNTISTWQLETGLNFEIPIRDWSGELYLTHGESNTYNVAGGSLSLARYRALINYPDYGRNAEGTGNIFYTVESENGIETIYAQRPAFGCGDFKCTSGFYDTIFGGDQPLSEDCFHAVYAVVQTRTEITQDIYELNLQGGVVDLWAGEVRAALGWQYRNVSGLFNPDILQSQDSFMDQVVGVYPTGYMDAETTVNDYYIEALIPVLSDLPLINKLEIETGARRSRYKETEDKEWTYKLLGNWQVANWLRLRGGYNRAIRAPNLGELFLAQQEIFSIGTVNFGDPCSVRANAPWGAGGTTLAFDETADPGETAPALAPGQTQEGADRTCQICEAMMGTIGADAYYRGIVGGVDQPNNFTQQTASFQFLWLLQEGNPNLDPETADTLTIGFVMSSPFEAPLLSGMTLALDYYDIKIEDAIMTYSVDYSNYRCFGVDTGLSPAEQAASPACQLIPRDQNNGGPLSTKLSYDNQGTIKTSGMDIMFNWFFDIDALGLNVPGSLNLNVQATILDSYETRQSPLVFDVPIEWKGSLGPTLPGTQGGAYDYRIFTGLTYAPPDNNWSATMRWRHLPGVWSTGHASQQALIANNARVAAGGDGMILGYTPGTDIKSDSYNIFDLSGTWDINETFTLRFGITNLFDKPPIYTGATAGYPEGSDKAVCNGAPGCTDPYSNSLPSVGSWGGMGGYYDTLGRRFFMGLKARF
jgi:iron complex outermembrane receptor protein